MSIRVGDENRRLSFHQRQELLYDKGQASYETREMSGSSLEDLDHKLLAQYAQVVAAPDANRLLVARGLGTGSTLTIAGVLLFADYPQRLLPEAFVRAC